MIERVAAIPAAATLRKKDPEHRRLILAHGEVTGHAHAFDAATVEGFQAETGEEYFRVRGVEVKMTLPILRAWRGQILVDHPIHGALEFAAADVTIEGKKAVIKGSFGFLRHDEHGTQAIPAGDYRGGATGKVRQREYSPEEIRNVAD